MAVRMRRKYRPGERRLGTIHTPTEIIRPVLVDGWWTADVEGTIARRAMQRLGFDVAPERSPPPPPPPPPPVEQADVVAAPAPTERVEGPDEASDDTTSAQEEITVAPAAPPDPLRCEPEPEPEARVDVEEVEEVEEVEAAEDEPLEASPSEPGPTSPEPPAPQEPPVTVAVEPAPGRLAAAWKAWQRRRPDGTEIPRHDLARAMSAQHGPIPGLDAALVTARRAVKVKGGLGVVMTCTGWTPKAEAATIRALDAATATGGTVVVVNNDANHPITIGRRKGLVQVECPDNDGFAAACNAGLERVPKKHPVVLFTQPDAEWTAKAAAQAASLSVALDVAVGPSGGNLVSGWIAERGTNVGESGPAAAVDFIAGFWLLAPRAALQAAAGWDPAYFLYWEDPDLCLRLALSGVRSVVWPDLGVKHERGGTIGPMDSGDTKRLIQAESTAAFKARWGSQW